MATGKGAMRVDDVLKRIKGVIDSLAGISTLLLVVFLALGFRFQTPGQWMSDTSERIDSVVVRTSSLEAQQEALVRQLMIVTRIMCVELTSVQAELVPECDVYRASELRQAGSVQRRR